MTDFPHHIKIIYIMILKKGYTVRQIINKHEEVYVCACEICGGWESFSQAEKARDDAIKLIKKYGIIDDEKDDYRFTRVIPCYT